MAIDWKTAQKNEKNFWDTIYVDQVKDIDTYSPWNETDFAYFSFQTFKRHKFNINVITNGSLVDLGCGPYGIIKGLSVFCQNNFRKLVGVDPLMSHYLKYNILKDTDIVKLVSQKVEDYSSIEKFDFVHSSNVIDHVDNPVSFIITARNIVSPEGVFMVSVHCINNFFIPFKSILKYIDKNHPHHLDRYQFESMLKQHFNRVEVMYIADMTEDQPEFTFFNIFKYKSLRSIKRYLSTLLMKNYYFNCYP